MAICLVVAQSAGDFVSPELRDRVAKSGKPSATTHYRVLEGNEEVAFVALDIIPGQDFIVLYELFMRSDRRGLGIGQLVMKAVEEHGRAHGFRKIKLRPHPLAETIAAEHLKLWYIRQGYSDDEFDQQLLKKDI